MFKTRWGRGGVKGRLNNVKKSDDLVSWSVPYPSIVLFHLYSVREDVKYYFANFVRKGGGSTLQIHNPFFLKIEDMLAMRKGEGGGGGSKVSCFPMCPVQIFLFKLLKNIP